MVHTACHLPRVISRVFPQMTRTPPIPRLRPTSVLAAVQTTGYQFVEVAAWSPLHGEQPLGGRAVGPWMSVQVYHAGVPGQLAGQLVLS